MLEPESTAVRRLEVITGTGRRRRFSEDDKASVIEETLVPGTVVSEVARRHGLTPQQVFTWRRQAKQATAASADREPSRFVPAVVDPPVSQAPVRRCNRTRQADLGCGISMTIEVEIEGVTVRVGHGAEPKIVAAVLRALRAGA